MAKLLMLAACVLPFLGTATVRLGSPFCDGMVLQRDRKVPVWGKADPGEKVTVEFAGQSLSSVANPDGRWRVDLAPMPASKVPRTMKVNDLTVRDVLVGEVWLASGQSNMALLIWNSGDPRVRDRNGAAISQIVRHDDVRYANLLDWKTSDTPQDSIAFTWRKHRNEEVTRGWDGGQSAVAFYFAELLRQALEVPIGVIVASAGGTRIQPFAPAEAWAASGLAEKHLKGSSPGVVWNHYFAPVAPYAARGLIWYQGETDSGYFTEAEYVRALGVFHRAWAKAFENPGFPLYIAQIGGGHAVPRAQAEYAHRTPNAYCAIGSDVMNAWDIHPNEKFTVSLRLAMLALRNAYGWADVKAESPFVKSVRVEAGGKARLSFDNAALFYSYAKDYTAQTPFMLQDGRGRWHPAKLENQVNVRFSKKLGRDTCAGHIRGVQLVVSSTNAPNPVAVAYTGDPTLAAVYNESALPIAPFERKLAGADARQPENSGAEARQPEPTFAERVKVRESAKVKGRIAALANVGLGAATEAEVAGGKYLVIPLVDPSTGKGYSEGALKTLLADRITWISARQLEGFVLDSSMIDDPEEPVLYFAAGWVSTVANDIWGF